MIRTAASVVVLAILVGSTGGCGDDTESTVPATAPATVAATDAGLTNAIEAYWDRLAAEEYAEAYDILSEECRAEIGEDDFVEGFRLLFAEGRSSGFDPTAQVVRLDIDDVEAGGDERVRAVQWSLAPSDDPQAEETLSITGGDQDTWTFDGEWHPDSPACGGGAVAAEQAPR